MTPHLSRALLVLALTALLAGCDTSINSTVEIEDGEVVEHSVHSVNGGIRVGHSATLRGSGQTVNGSIRVDDDAKVEDLTTVNGSIRLGRAVEVDGDLQTVNGAITAEQETVVTGDVASVNGRIVLEGAEVHGSVSTRNGDVSLEDGAIVRRDLVIERSTGSFGSGRLVVEIRDRSVVEGDVVVEGDREVRLLVEDGSEIRGEVRGVEVERRGAAGAEEKAESAPPED